MPIQNRSTVLSIDDILKSAIVAGAAYSDLTINDTFQERETRLVNSGFFDAQSANNFATEFSLIGSLNDNSPGGTLRTPGLDLYVFQDSADKIYISIDGTEDGRSATPDWIENIHSIVAGGPSIYQPEIENFIKELVDNGTIKPDSVVEIVGHSQGGAQAVFAEGVLRARIGENANTRVVTFNAPGVGGTGGFFADVVDFALGRIPSTILYPSDSGRIFNVTLNNDRVSHFGITRGETITLNAGYNIAQFLSAHSIDNVRNYVASIEANTRGSFGEDAKMVVNFETGAFAWLMPITNPDGSKDVYLVTELGVRENVENDPKLRTLLSQVTDVVRPDVAEQLRLNADPNASVQSSTWTSFLTLPTPNTVTFDLQPISFQQGLNRFDIQKNWATSRANARIGDKVYDLTIYTTAAEDGTALRVTEARDPNNSGAPAFYSQSYTTAAGETVAIVENFEDGTLNEYRRASSGRFGFNSVTSLTENASGDGFERGDTEFNITEIGDAEVIGGDEIGSIFGSTLGRQVAGDSVFTQVAVSSLFAELGERIGLSAEVLLELDDIGLFNALEQAFQEFDSGLFDRVKSQGVGALSSFLTAELLGALGVDGFAGELLNTAGGTALGGILTNFDDIINNTTSIKDVIGPLELGNVVGSFVGGKIAGEIASFDTIGGQLGASLGSAAGTAALGSVFSNAAAAGAANVLGGGSATAFQSFATKLGGLAGPVGAAVGAVAGFLLGGVIGSLFGGTPRSGADVRWRDGEFVVDNVWSRKGGSEEAAESLASQVAGTLNGVLALVGGELLNGEDVTGGTYGMRKKDFTYREAQSREERDIKLKTRDSGAVIKKGSFTALSDFQVAGGDIIGKRAVTSSLALSGETAFSMEALVGDLAVASDYASYLANPSIINSLIASDPDSAFAAGWILTRVRAVELGLHKRAASDWYGGWDVALGVYDGPEGAEYTPGQLSFDLVGKERVTSLVDAGGGFVLGSYGDTIDTAGKDEIAVTGDLTVAGDNGDTIADTAGLTINGEAGVSGQSQTIDVAAVIRGNASDNTIRGGDLGNDIFGGAGDDELRGGKLDDWLFGEAGDDMLYAGDTAEVNAGNAGNGNLLDGGEGDDQLFGGQGSDWLEGGAGTDTLYGGSGDDILAGGADGGSGGGLLLDDAIFSAGLAATTTGDFSLSLDVALASTDQSGYIAHVRREGSNARIIELRYRGNTSFLGVRMSNGPEVGFDVDINDGEVYNIVAVWDHDEADLKLYLNGIEANRRAGSETITPRAPTTTDPMTIGFAKRYNTNFTDVNQFGDESLPSTFYGAKFYDRALTSQEVVDGNSTDGLLNDLEVNANANEVVDRVTQLPAALAERPGNPPGTSYAWVAASDLLDGGDGSDQYLFRSGDGSDVVKEGAAPAPERATDLQPAESLTIAEHIARLSDSGATLNDWRGTSAHETVDLQAAGGDDVLVLGPGIGWENIRMRQAGDDLIISLVERDANDDPIATDDQITLSDWFTSRETRVERLRLADGQEVALGYTNFLYGDDGNNQIYGTAERDFIFGGRGSDEIAALGGADFANGGPDYDFVSGGSDEDLVIGSTGDDILAGDSGTDTVLGGDGDDYVLGNQGDDRIAGGAGADILAGGEGNDTFQYGRGDGNDIVIDTFADGDWVKFWDGDTPSGYSKHDQIIYEGSAADPTQIVYEFGVMHDWIHYNSDGTSAFANNENTIGYYHNVSINSVDDNGTDKIEFDIGIDIADIHMQWDGDDLVLGIGSAAGTSGAFADLTDTITLKDWNAAGKPIEQFQFFHTGIVETSEFDVWGGKGAGPTDGDDTLTGSLVRDWLTGNAGNDDLTGLDGNDILNGNGGQDRLVGGEGEDILFGGAGNDVLEGGAHADILLGGSGLDIASYANALPIPDQSWLGPGIPFTLPGGPLVASLANPSENTGDAESDAYDSIEGLEGSAYDDKLIGDQFDNDIIGGAGNDRLEGGLGGDTYIFGIGDGIDIIADDGGAEDILSFEEGIALSDLSFAYNGNNLVIGYNGGADQITIESFDDAAKQIETLQFADGTSANLAGLRLNGGTDTNQNPTPEELIVGEGALDGGAGNDTLIGRGTNNTLRGGDDNDVLVAGQGVDELDGGAENRDAVTNAPLDGGDWANYTGSNAGIIVDLDGHFSPGVAATGGYAQGDWFTGIESVAGSQFRDEIYGTSGHNVLQGHGGDDKLIGRTGNDILLGGSGVDELKGSNGDDVLDGGAGNDDLLGGRHKDALFGGDGNDRLDGHTEDDVLYGGQGDDRLYGSSGNDQLDGGLGWDRLSAGAGNDILFAGAGGDSLKSGSGEDQFIVQAFGDTITHLENSGDLDTLELIGFDITALTFRLYNGDLQIRDANGGGLNYINWSVGGSGAVSALRSITLDGRVLSAFDLDAALPANGDWITYADVQTLWQTSALYVDNAVYTGSASGETIAAEAPFEGGATFNGLAGDDTINGTAFDDVIDGGAGNDILNGGAGDDVFIAGEGDDNYVGDDGADTVDYSAQSAGQTIDLSDTTKFTSIESVIGSSGNDIITGTAASETFTGGAGDDVIEGGAGDADTLVLSGAYADYDLDSGPGVDQFTIIHTSPGAIDDGLDRFRGIEFIQFSDRLFDVGTFVPRPGTEPQLINITSAEIDEGTGTRQVGIFTTDDVNQDSTEDLNQEDGFTYRILEDQDGPDWEQFSIVGKQLYVVEPVDHETKDELIVKIEVEDQDGFTTTRLLTIAINDINEAPTGIDYAINPNTQQREIGSVLENVPGGSIGTLVVDDPDNDLFNGFADHHIDVVDDNRFEVVNYGLKLKDGIALDYEAVDGGQITINVRATDLNGNGESTNLTSIIINVGDVQEIIPRPTNITLSRPSIDETSNAVAPIILSAEDPNQVGGHTFQIVPNDSGDMLDGGRFAINNNNELTLIGGVDHEVDAELKLRIRAIDNQTHYYEQDITIIINDVNERPTNVYLAPDGEPGNIAENDPGAVIGTLQADDPDKDPNNNFNLHQFTVDDTNRFEIVDRTTLKLKDGVSLNYEAGSSVVVNVTARDLDGTGLISDPKPITINIADRDDYINGTPGPDALTGEKGRDIISGFEDVDVLNGLEGNDWLIGGEGGDELHGGSGEDLLEGGLGEDHLSGGDQNDILRGGADNDELDGGAGRDELYGDAGDDILKASAGDDTYIGGEGVDTVTYAGQGSADADLSTGTFIGVENLVGSVFGDTLKGDGAANDIRGGDGIDTIDGQGGDDTIYGGDGDDIISGGAGGDTLYGGAGIDTIRGNEGSDYLYGEDGNDILIGGEHGDHLYGGLGNDTIDAGSGGDMLDGGVGNDDLTGGAGSDTYKFDRMSGQDKIFNYDSSQSTDYLKTIDAITPRDVWFERRANPDYDDNTAGNPDDLVLSVLGTTTEVTIVDWFAQGTDYFQIDVTQLPGRNADNVNVMELLQLMQPHAKPSGNQIGDALWSMIGPRVLELWERAVAPVLSPVSNQSTNEDSAKTIALNVRDDFNLAQVAIRHEILSGAHLIESITTQTPNVELFDGTINLTVDSAVNQSGTATIRLYAEDGSSETSNQVTFDLQINAINDAPLINGITIAPEQPGIPQTNVTLPDVVFLEDAGNGNNTLSITVQDIDGPQGEPTVAGVVRSDNHSLLAPGNIVVPDTGETRVITFNTKENQHGTAEVQIDFTDGTDITTVTFDVVVNSVNDLPTFEQLPSSISIAEDAGPQYFTIEINDDDDVNGDLHFEVISGNAAVYSVQEHMYREDNQALGRDPNERYFSITPLEDKHGSGVLELRIRDDIGNPWQINDTVSVTITPQPDAPTIVVNSNNLGGLEEDGSPGQISLTVSDDDLSPGNFSSLVVTPPSSSKVAITRNDSSDAATGTYLYDVTPLEDEFGDEDLTFTVRGNNGTGLQDSVTVTASIAADNDPSTFKVLPGPIALNEEDPAAYFEVEIDDVDFENGDLHFDALSQNASLFTVAVHSHPQNNSALPSDPNKRYFSVTPQTEGNGGTAAIEFRIREYAGQDWIRNSSVQVTVTPINDAPTIALNVGLSPDLDVTNGPELKFTEDGGEKEITLTIDDDDDVVDALVVTHNGAGNSLVTVSQGQTDGNNLKFKIKPIADANGDTTLTFRVRDDDYEYSAHNVEVPITIDAVNDRPNTPTVNTVRSSVLEESGTTHVATFSASDIDSSDVDFEFVGGDTGYFILNQDTGVLQLKTIDFDNQTVQNALNGSNQLEVSVRARDNSGSATATSLDTASFAVEIQARNEFGPVLNTGNSVLIDLVKEQYLVNIPPPNTRVGAIEINAPDADFTDTVTYGILENQDAITIDENTGIVYLDRGFNYDTMPGGPVGQGQFQPYKEANFTVRVTSGNDTLDVPITVQVENVPEKLTLVDTSDGISYGGEAIPWEPFVPAGSVGYSYHAQPTLFGDFRIAILDGSTRVGYAIGDIDMQNFPALSDDGLHTFVSEDARFEWVGGIFQTVDEITPIILDLDGDGAELVSLAASTTTFDQNGDGLADLTGWVGADDALLVLDRNGNGTIDDGSEISFVQDLPGATTDMEGLVAYDTNQDGVFDAQDNDFGRFQVWQDANSDGVSQADELSTLDEAGVAGIDLALTPTGQTLENTADNVIFNTAAFIKADGSRGEIADVAFRYLDGAAQSAAEAAYGNQADSIVPVGDAASTRALQSMVQAMAAFGGDAGATGLDFAGRDAQETDRPWLASQAGL